MPIEDLAAAAKQTADLVRNLISAGGFQLKFRVTAGPGAKDPSGLENRLIYVEMAGADSDLLTDRKGELLRAFEHIAAKHLHLEPHEHDAVSFDSGGFKADRAAALHNQAERAAAKVRDTGEPYVFAAMNSRERRLTHIAFRPYEDLRTESLGEGQDRAVVVYPKDYDGPTPRLRSRFDDRRGGGHGRGGFGNNRGGGGGNRGRGGFGNNRGGGGRGRGRY